MPTRLDRPALGIGQLQLGLGAGPPGVPAAAAALSLAEPVGLAGLAQAAIGRGQREPHRRLGEPLEPGPLDLLAQRDGPLQPLRCCEGSCPSRQAASPLA